MLRTNAPSRRGGREVDRGQTSPPLSPKTTEQQIQACCVKLTRLKPSDISMTTRNKERCSQSTQVLNEEAENENSLEEWDEATEKEAEQIAANLRPCSVLIAPLVTSTLRKELQADQESLVQPCSVMLSPLSAQHISRTSMGGIHCLSETLQRQTSSSVEDGIGSSQKSKEISATNNPSSNVDVSIRSFYECSISQQASFSYEMSSGTTIGAKVNYYTSISKAPIKSSVIAEEKLIGDIKCPEIDREPFYSDPIDQLDRGVNVGKVRLKVELLDTDLPVYPSQFAVPMEGTTCKNDDDTSVESSDRYAKRCFESIKRGPKRSEITALSRDMSSSFRICSTSRNIVTAEVGEVEREVNVEEHLGDIDAVEKTSSFINSREKGVSVVRVRRDSGDSVGSILSNNSSIETNDELEENKNPNSKVEVETAPRVEEKIRSGAINETLATTRLSDISGPSADNTHAFKLDIKTDLKKATAKKECRFTTLMSMEAFPLSRSSLLPDPEYDALQALFISVKQETKFNEKRKDCIMIVSSSNPTNNGDAFVSYCQQRKREPKNEMVISFYESEMHLLVTFAQLVKTCDPDILVGYEVQQSSWGYVIERASALQMDLISALSRVPLHGGVAKNRQSEEEGLSNAYESYAARKTSELRLLGRIVLNVWRLLRSELAFTSYTFENMMFHVLHTRTAKHDHSVLSEWWATNTNHKRFKVVDYYLLRSSGSIALLDKFDFVGRTSELARLFGIQFEEVISRGSQFRVESIMLRRGKKQDSVAVSPSIQQRAQMKAPEYLPLILEPESRFYGWPVLVLDFQSLYPSIIIAYNYCYSTCIGRIALTGGRNAFEFGATNLNLSLERLKRLEDHLNFSPLGVGFVKGHLRKGLLPKMLEDILDARLMVKRSMKLHKSDDLLQRVLHARQLGLKLIANVTYGYTSANFSGRMPCIEVGDSVVSKGRETLERAIKTIESRSEWGARVVYGDTDSLFVLLKGKSRSEAFRIGNQMALAVTNENPKPVKLKFEKVYEPCILQTKKRYVGFMYETVEQKEPVYEAKGIETVRRDGCPAVVKMLEKTLRLLFTTKDMSVVKRYVQRQFSKLLRNSVSLQDLTFAKEFRGLENYRPTAVVPALELAKRHQRLDRRCIPRIGERVPYIIVHGQPGEPLIKSVRTPLEVIKQQLRPNATYYIVKVIAPPLDRCLSLVGADVHLWFSQMPRRYVKQKLWSKLNVSYQQPCSSTGASENDSHSCITKDPYSLANTPRPATISSFNYSSLIATTTNSNPSGTTSTATATGAATTTTSLSQYFTPVNCNVCSELIVNKSRVQEKGCALKSVCESCLNSSQKSVMTLVQRSRDIQKVSEAVHQLCRHCLRRSEAMPHLCSSLDCPIFYKRQRANADNRQVGHIHAVLKELQASTDDNYQLEAMNMF